jgi:uncharacterized membrane protein YhaH (DUF805 family)
MATNLYSPLAILFSPNFKMATRKLHDRFISVILILIGREHPKYIDQ